MTQQAACAVLVGVTAHAPLLGMEDPLTRVVRKEIEVFRQNAHTQ